jgi:hypothetical protein
MNMTSNGKTLNYKVVDLVENYNFYLHPSLNKKVTIFFKTDCTPTAVGHGGMSQYTSARYCSYHRGAWR